MRGHRLAVRPAGILPQVERVRFLVVGDVPAFGDAGQWFERLRVEPREAFENVANDAVLRQAGDGGPVERFDFGFVDEREIGRRQVSTAARPSRPR